jgi:hypothetical protein
MIGSVTPGQSGSASPGPIPPGTPMAGWASVVRYPWQTASRSSSPGIAAAATRKSRHGQGYPRT